MNIYNPLQTSNQSFSSRVLDSVNRQAEKKQSSIDKMNETLRAEAAQGRLGSIANNLLEQALEEASSQGLIGVNQYDVMNKAMPKFYAAKSAITDLNNSYNAELEAAKADDRIRVDANYLKYLNDKYYNAPEGEAEIGIDNITGHAANVINKGFNLADNSQFLNMDIVGKQLVDSVGDLTMTTQNELGGGQYTITTSSGKVQITPEGAKQLMQNDANMALVKRLTGEEIVSPEMAAQVINGYIQSRSKTSETTSDIKITSRAQSQMDYREALGIQSAGIKQRDKVDQNIKDYRQRVSQWAEQNDISINEAVAQMRKETYVNDKGETVYKYNSKELGRAGAELNAPKKTTTEAANVTKGKNVESKLSRSNLSTPKGVVSAFKGLPIGTGSADTKIIKDNKKINETDLNGNDLIKGADYVKIELSFSNDRSVDLYVPVKDGEVSEADQKKLIEQAATMASNSQYAPDLGSFEGVGSDLLSNSEETPAN